MRLQLGLAVCFLLAITSPLASQDRVAPGATAIVTSLVGKVYLLKAGQTGSVLVLENGKAVPFVEGLEDPRGLATHLDGLFVVGKDRVWHVDGKGKAQVHLAANQFPRPPVSLKHVVVEAKTGTLFVLDGGDGSGKGAAVFRVDGTDKAVALVTDSGKIPGLKSPDRLLRHGASRLFICDPVAGTLFYVNTATGESVNGYAGLAKASRLAWDYHGRLFAITDGGLVVIPPETKQIVKVPGQLPANADIFLEPEGVNLLVLDPATGSVQKKLAQVPGMEVDTTPLPVTLAPAFTSMTWTGWSAEDSAGLANPFRPILLTHAGDSSGRVFVGTQHGVVHAFKPQDGKSHIFLDISKKIHINLKTENEQGLLGLAFHPRFQTNREFFVFYTRAENKKINVLARYKVSATDPSTADPSSEEVLFEVERPSWNRDGGTLSFGPDGFLYAVTGDGGPAGAPLVQKLDNLLGKAIRIDVDRKANGKNYAIPTDNPFVGTAGALPEIWAYGLRNTWRIAFDKPTGLLYGGENGQDLYDEIILIKKGGNYGWNNRESFHPYSPSAAITKDNVDPIWEYTRPLGLAIVGGGVYRGKGISELDGYYLYGDYITGNLWGLRYDNDKGRVVADRSIPKSRVAFISFGTDEQGEMYLLSEAPDGRGIQKLVRAAAK